MATTNPENPIISSSVIDTASLSNNISPIVPTLPVYNTNGQATQAAQAGAYTESSFIQAENQAKQAEEMARTTLTGQNSDLARLQSSIGGKGQETLNAYNTADSTGNSVNTLAGKLRGLSAQSQALGYKQQIIPSEIQNKVAGTGATDRGIAPDQAQQQRENFIQQASIAMQSAIAKADYDTAKSFADQVVDAKYDQKLADIEAAKTNLENIRFTLSSAEKKVAETTTARLNKEKQNYEKKIADEKRVYDESIKKQENERADRTAFNNLLSTAAATGIASPEQLAFLSKNAKNMDDFFAMGGSEFLAKDTTKFIEMSDGSTIMVNAKTGELLKKYGNSNTTVASTGENQNALTYARQFATDGKMPSLTDLQKLGTTPAEITRMAKELPKQKGEIVSTQTGVKNTSLSAPVQEDFTRLYNITQNIARLKELDKKRIGGLAAGTLGIIFGSADQTTYLTTRKAIVDDISRMQSGAALTLDEVAFYQDYLPGRWSEFLLLGEDSMNKINNFETEMNTKLKNGLNTNGLSVYGYSTVKIGDKEYKVGDEIDIKGMKGIILPDGTFSAIKGQAAATSSLTSSPVSVSNVNKGIVGGYDIKSYATDPNHEVRVSGYYNKTANLQSPEEITSYIKSVTPSSPIVAQDVIDAARATGTSTGMILAIMQQDSTFGTKGVAVRTKNPGNVGNTDDGSTRSHKSWREGVLATAKNLKWRKIT